MWRWLRAEVQSEAARERKEKTRRMKKEKSVRKLVQEKRRCCRGAEQLSVHVWVCVHGAPARVWLGAFKARGCVCVCTRTCVYVLLFLCMKVCRKGEEKKQQGQNVIELVSKWEKEKKRANYRNCRGQFSASLSPSKLAALLRLCSI